MPRLVDRTTLPSVVIFALVGKALIRSSGEIERYRVIFTFSPGGKGASIGKNAPLEEMSCVNNSKTVSTPCDTV